MTTAVAVEAFHHRHRQAAPRGWIGRLRKYYTLTAEHFIYLSD
jgi:hypothetical protein